MTEGEPRAAGDFLELKLDAGRRIAFVAGPRQDHPSGWFEFEHFTLNPSSPSLRDPLATQNEPFTDARLEIVRHQPDTQRNGFDQCTPNFLTWMGIILDQQNIELHCISSD